MNKYLIKIAETVYSEDVQREHSPFKTALTESVLAIPVDMAGVAAGNRIGDRFKLNYNFGKYLGGTHNVGGMAGAALGGLAANYAVLKGQQS